MLLVGQSLLLCWWLEAVVSRCCWLVVVVGRCWLMGNVQPCDHMFKEKSVADS